MSHLTGATETGHPANVFLHLLLFYCVLPLTYWSKKANVMLTPVFRGWSVVPLLLEFSVVRSICLDYLSENKSIG